MNKFSRLPRLAAAISALLFALPAHALFCGNNLVFAGLAKMQVLQRCGAPDFVDHRIEYRLASQLYPLTQFPQQVGIPVDVEEWIYDFGPQRFMELLRFENGRLHIIQNLGYGR